MSVDFPHAKYIKRAMDPIEGWIGKYSLLGILKIMGFHKGSPFPGGHFQVPSETSEVYLGDHPRTRKWLDLSWEAKVPPPKATPPINKALSRDY